MAPMEFLSTHQSLLQESDPDGEPEPGRRSPGEAPGVTGCRSEEAPGATGCRSGEAPGATGCRGGPGDHRGLGSTKRKSSESTDGPLTSPKRPRSLGDPPRSLHSSLPSSFPSTLTSSTSTLASLLSPPLFPNLARSGHLVRPQPWTPTSSTGPNSIQPSPHPTIARS